MVRAKTLQEKLCFEALSKTVNACAVDVSLMFCVTEGADVEEGIAIEVPQISSAAEITSVTPDQDAGEEITIEVPQIEVAQSPSVASDAGPPTQLSGQALSDTSLLDKKEDEEEQEEQDKEEEEEEIEEEEGKEADEDDDDGGGDDDDKDKKAKVAAKDEPDDETGLLPEYMIAESMPDLPTVDGQHISFLC